MRPEGAPAPRGATHGPGLDRARGARCVARFSRAAPGRSRDRGGSGLGRSSVASITHALGGRLGDSALMRAQRVDQQRQRCGGGDAPAFGDLEHSADLGQGGVGERRRRDPQNLLPAGSSAHPLTALHKAYINSY